MACCEWLCGCAPSGCGCRDPTEICVYLRDLETGQRTDVCVLVGGCYSSDSWVTAADNWRQVSALSVNEPDPETDECTFIGTRNRPGIESQFSGIEETFLVEDISAAHHQRPERVKEQTSPKEALVNDHERMNSQEPDHLIPAHFEDSVDIALITHYGDKLSGDDLVGLLHMLCSLLHNQVSGQVISLSTHTTMCQLRGAIYLESDRACPPGTAVFENAFGKQRVVDESKTLIDLGVGVGDMVVGGCRIFFMQPCSAAELPGDVRFVDYTVKSRNSAKIGRKKTQPAAQPLYSNNIIVSPNRAPI